MKKVGLYLTVIVSIAVLAIYFLQFRKINNNYSSKNFKFSIPKVLLIKENVAKNNYIGNPVVWGLKGYGRNSVGSSGSGQKNNDFRKTGFIYKNIGGIPTLCKISDKNYKWEFYGTVYKDKTIKAIFYNPALEKNKVTLIEAGSVLDRGLFVKKIENNYVEIDYIGSNKEKKVFKLKIFVINKQFLKGDK